MEEIDILYKMLNNLFDYVNMYRKTLYICYIHTLPKQYNISLNKWKGAYKKQTNRWR